MKFATLFLSLFVCTHPVFIGDGLLVKVSNSAILEEAAVSIARYRVF